MKYPNKQLGKLIRFLFHGTRFADPLIIATGKVGLDVNFSRVGSYGRGIYFADNAEYSNTFKHEGI